MSIQKTAVRTRKPFREMTQSSCFQGSLHIECRVLREFGDGLAHLVLPIGPVVAALWTPVVERMANVLRRENAGEMVCGAGVFPLAAAGGQVSVAGPELLVG